MPNPNLDPSDADKIRKRLVDSNEIVERKAARSDNEHDYTEVKDSGGRTEYDTGAVRDVQTGRGRFDLISPIALRRLAIHYENGAKKYDERNWEKGIPLSRFFDSAVRHMFQFVQGDKTEDHLAAVAWNVFGLIHIEQLIKSGDLPAELDDLPQ